MLVDRLGFDYKQTHFSSPLHPDPSVALQHKGQTTDALMHSMQNSNHPERKSHFKEWLTDSQII